MGLFGSLKNIAERLRESVRQLRWPDEVYDPAGARRIQIRLDSSEGNGGAARAPGRSGFFDDKSARKEKLPDSLGGGDGAVCGRLATTRRPGRGGGRSGVLPISHSCWVLSSIDNLCKSA